MAGGHGTETPGFTGRQDTTEILVEGSAAWKIVGKLPTAVSGLTGATLGNKVYMFGMKICFFRFLFSLKQFRWMECN